MRWWSKDGKKKENHKKKNNKNRSKTEEGRDHSVRLHAKFIPIVIIIYAKPQPQ